MVLYVIMLKQPNDQTGKKKKKDVEWKNRNNSVPMHMPGKFTYHLGLRENVIS